MRIGIVQMRCEKAATERNIEAIAEYAIRAHSEGVDIVAFPEMCVGGYVFSPSGDRLYSSGSWEEGAAVYRCTPQRRSRAKRLLHNTNKR